MSEFIIKMPDIGEGIAEVEIVEWHVAVGDSVIEDQVLADVMTDKASVEIPSSVTGTVLSLGGDVGEVLAVGADLITISTDASAATKPVDTPKSEPVQQPAAAQPAAPAPVAAPAASTAAVRQAASQNTPAPAVSSAQTSGGKVLASPSVRKRARQLGVDLTTVSNTSGTPISHSDLDNHLLKQNGVGTSTPAASSSYFNNFDYDEIPDKQINVVGMRRQIALKMQESKRNIPHFSYVDEVDVTELENLRKTLNSDAGDNQPKLTLLPFLIKAMVIAIRKFPEVNSRYDDDAGVVTQYGSVHMGMATQTDRGLMVPVIQNAQNLNIWQCAAQILSTASATRSGTLNRDQLTGSTITLTSLGALGGIVSTPIINRPEVAIVGVNRMMDKLVLQNGVPVVRKTMNLSSSFDHRIIDGMQAAMFIQEIKRLLETPALLFVNHNP